MILPARGKAARTPMDWSWEIWPPRSRCPSRTSWDFARGARQPIAATPAAICAALDAAGMTFAGERDAPTSWEVIMLNMKIITLVTLVLMISVYLLHGITFFTKLIIGLLLFAGWVFFAIVRTTSERRRARQSRDMT
ncbi:hypothetical protein ACNHKD_01450 [Methylocystis sp. JAN1]|uniref:hypothetical protein n=1 Tax=Methylocystis sp. JAN1 TaxID=3397211 RepID=UPI003FA2E581